jgi:DNA polymerase-3 subunit epsilon
MSLDFTAVDFQTANSHPASVCAVGLVRIRDGQVAGKSGGLVRPPTGLGEFTDYQISLHGITAEMAATAPLWRKVAAWITQYVGSDVFICHNATFAIGVLRNACAADAMPLPTADFLCTALMARQAFRLPSYRLPFVADKCGIELTGRHQVLINARGAALIAVTLARRHGATNPGELAARSPRRTSPSALTSSSSATSTPSSSPPARPFRAGPPTPSPCKPRAKTLRS